MENAKLFLKSFTICEADVMCSCGAFCHGSGSRGCYVGLNSDLHTKGGTPSMIVALEREGVKGINRGLSEIKLPYRLEVVCDEERAYKINRVLESEAKRKSDDFQLVPPTSDHYQRIHNGHNPIAYVISGRIGEIETEYKTEPVYEQTGTEVEEYEEPVYETVTRDRTEKYTETEHRSRQVPKQRRIDKLIKKDDSIPFYNTWTKRWEKKEYYSYYTKTEYETDYVTENYDHPVEKTRYVPYTEQVHTGTRTLTRDVPTYGYVHRDIPYRYCTPTIVPCYIYLIPIEKCVSCRCVFCSGVLREPPSDEVSFVDQWCSYFKEKSIESCLICGISHQKHNERSFSSDTFYPQRIDSTHDSSTSHSQADQSLKASQELCNSCGYYFGTKGRNYVSTLFSKTHNCLCFACIRALSHSWFMRWVASDVTLDEEGFTVFTAQLCKSYKLFLSLTPNDRKKINQIIVANVQKQYAKSI